MLKRVELSVERDALVRQKDVAADINILYNEDEVKDNKSIDFYNPIVLLISEMFRTVSDSRVA